MLAFICLCLALLALVCLHLHHKTPLGIPPLCYFSLSSLSSTEDKQDNMHQGFHLGDQQALKTFATTSSTKCSPLELWLPLKIRNPFLDPSRLHKIPQLESLTMCLTQRIAREPVKPQQPCYHWVHYGTSGHSERAHYHPKIAPELMMP